MLEDGIHRVARIDWRLAPYDWAFPHEHVERIEANWDARRRAAPGLYNGRALLMRDLELTADSFRCACFETSYKNFLAWRDGGFPTGDVYNCFGMAALRAADGAFMLGAMNANTASAGKLYFPAGTPEPCDADAAGQVDLQGNVLRELGEETGLAPHDLAEEAGWTVVVAGSRIACMKVYRSAATAEALRARLAAFNAGQADPELDDLVPVRRAADYDHARMPDFMVTYLDWALTGGAAGTP